MKFGKSTLPFVFSLLLVPAGLHAQAGGGKVVAKVGDWQIRKFTKYCVATVGFEGDRALRIYSGADSFSFGFMGPGSATAAAKTPITYWFGNDVKNKFTRTAVKRSNQAEDGGAPWLILVDPASEPSHAANFEMDKSVTFTYKADGAAQKETFSLKDAKAVLPKLFACSGQ